MFILTSDGATLRVFAASVLRAAEDTLAEAIPVVSAVVGGILLEADPGSIQVQPAEGEADVLWATFGGRRAVFRYNAMTAMVEMREDRLDGHPARMFGRRSLQMDIVNFFGAVHDERRRAVDG